MKIYTYYDNIENKHPGLKYEHQKQMLDLWKTSWENAGFEPQILYKKDAQNSLLYDEFTKNIKDIHLEIIKKEIQPYGLSCYTRWLAYSTQPDEYFYVSDYDCINNGLEPIIETDKLHLMDDACPCFASGSSAQFANLCHLFVEISNERINEILKMDKTVCYHDQDFFVKNMLQKNNPNAQALLEKNNILITRDRKNDVGPFELNKQNTVKVLHISHHNANNIKKSVKDFERMSIDEVRIQIMENIVNNTWTIN